MITGSCGGESDSEADLPVGKVKALVVALKMGLWYSGVHACF